MTTRTRENDQIIRYSRRQMRRSIMAGLAILKPATVRQLVHQSEGPPTNQFRTLVNQLIRQYCSRWVAHLENHPTYDLKHDLLFSMIYYHEIWEGFRECEPWGASENCPVTYFLDINYDRRIREMDATFPTYQ